MKKETTFYESPQIEVSLMQTQECILDGSDGAAIDDYNPVDWVW